MGYVYTSGLEAVEMPMLLAQPKALGFCIPRVWEARESWHLCPATADHLP